MKPKKKLASKVKIPAQPPLKPFPQPKPLYPVKVKGNSSNQSKAPVGDQRLAAQSTAKIPNSIRSKNYGRAVATGIVKMNATGSLLLSQMRSIIISLWFSFPLQ